MAAIVQQAAQPEFTLTYLGRDITASVEHEVLSLRYTDVLEGESDTLDVELMDPDGHWRGGWWPKQGDKVATAIGWRGEPLSPCGEFVIDEVSHEGPPDRVTLRALAAETTKALRSNRHLAYEATTLKAIAQAVAARNGLKVVGTVPDFPIQRATQKDETDLAFLKL
jgi:phage protein D